MVLLEPLENTSIDFEFAFDLKRAAIGPYVEDAWGWDEGYERKLHQSRWDERRFFAIQDERHTVGTVAIDVFEDHIDLGELYIDPERSEHGIGSMVLKGISLRAEIMGVPVRVEVMKENPDVELYEAHGFSIVAQTETHYEMERRPDVSGQPNRILA